MLLKKITKLLLRFVYTQECSISPPGESKGRNFGTRPRLSVDSRSFFDKIKPKKYENHHQDEEDDQEGDTSTKIETLPLFPIHGGTHHDFFGMKSEDLSLDHGTGGYYTGGNWYNGRASLELSLNSYGYFN